MYIQQIITYYVRKSFFGRSSLTGRINSVWTFNPVDFSLLQPSLTICFTYYTTTSIHLIFNTSFHRISHPLSVREFLHMHWNKLKNHPYNSTLFLILVAAPTSSVTCSTKQISVSGYFFALKRNRISVLFKAHALFTHAGVETFSLW